ncbi:MAG: HvfC/BufC family peptide modification chaperone [Candidatus Binataceae bacterium]
MPLALKDTQELLYRLIAAPSGVAGGLVHERALPRGGLDAIIGGDARMPAVERLDIYANMYFYRLLEILTNDFPGVTAAVGADNFHNIVTGYLIELPPTEPSVFWAGRHLADFLRTHPILREFPYLADLAALERAIVEVFCARDMAALDAAAMRAIPHVRWPSVRMRAVAAFEVIEADWRVAPILRAVEGGRKFKAPRQGASRILVWRPRTKVFYREVDPIEAGAIAKLHRGATFGEVCTTVSKALGDSPPGRDPVAAINSILARWLRDGIVAIPTARKRRANRR